MHDIVMVLSNLPDRDTAEKLARHLLDRRLAACVNILAPCRSVYRWQGQVECADEVPVLIKSTAARYAELETAIRAMHPYEVPEIIALPVAQGFEPYLQWVRTETGSVS